MVEGSGMGLSLVIGLGLIKVRLNPTRPKRKPVVLSQAVQCDCPVSANSGHSAKESLTESIS
jgi:hypothetical protein